MTYQTLLLKVFPSSSTEAVLPPREGKNQWTIHTREPAQNGRATKDTLRLLAQHLGISSNKLVLVRGYTTQTKTVHWYP